MGRTKQRSGFAALIAAVLFGGACGGGAPSTQNAGPIKVGFLLPLTGVFAPNAQDLRDGWNLGLKDAGDTVNGRKIETTILDDAADPNTGLTDARQLIETQKVDILGGPIAANVGLAIRAYVAGTGIPTVYPAACSVEHATTEKANNIILTAWTCDQPGLNFGKYAVEKLGYKHITTVGLDYAFGWQSIGGFLAAFKAAGGTVDKQIWAPLNTTDFSPFVTQIPRDTQAVFALMAGATSVRFTQAYKALGLKDRVPLIGGGTLTDYSALRSEAPDTVLGAVTVLQYADGIDTPANRKFVDLYKGATGKLPSYYAESGYATAKLVVAALKKVGANTRDRASLIKAFKTTTFEAPRGPVAIDQDTNSPVQNIYIRRVDMVDGVPRNVVVETIKNSPPWGPISKQEWLKISTHYARTG